MIVSFSLLQDFAISALNFATSAVKTAAHSLTKHPFPTFAITAWMSWSG
jgi:hypothetical protein